MADRDSIPSWMPREYLPVREISGHGWCGVRAYAYTYALVCGIDETGYQNRYCYEYFADAVNALARWDGDGDPPGPWIKHKPSERLGPGATDE